MIWVNVKRIVKSGFLSFWRNGFITLSSVLVMTVTLFVLGSLVLTGVMLNSTLTELKSQVDMNVYFTTEASEESILEVKAALEAQANVASVEYLSREDALARFREQHKNDELTLQALEELGENPLGALLNVQAKDTTQYESIARAVNEHPLITAQPSILDKMSYFDERQRIAIERLTRITESGNKIGFALIIFLAFITVAITFNTIRLVIYTSRDEIQVMRLVGATQMYVRAPFMVQGVLYGASAAIATLVLLYPFTFWLGTATENFFGGINIFAFYATNFFWFFLLLLGTGIILGAISSYLAIRRYLTV